MPEEICIQNILNEVLAEIEKQDNRWGTKRVLRAKTWLTILMEEVGEIARAELEGDYDNYRVELIQTAAVCLQAIQSLDLAHNKFKG